ncbi:hypothetical protein ABKV19_022377 [Rosa sericea]
MQRRLSIVFLPLFLYLLFAIGFVFYCYSDIRNSELSKSPSISNLVMASKIVSRETKRMLAQCDNSQNSTSMRTDKSRRSKRWKTACQQQATEASNSFCGNDEQNSAVILNRDVSVNAEGTFYSDLIPTVVLLV